MARRPPPRASGEGLLCPTARPKGVLALDDMIAALVELDANGLCLQWRNHLGGTPPAHLPRWLLLRILAYRIQAAAFGGLDKETLRVLRQPKGQRLGSSDLHPFQARIATTREGTKLNAGALLAHEWNGRLERVMILDQGVAWNGETYGSLSQVAKAMTGTSWNGHRFFGLRTARSDRSGIVPRRSRGCETASLDVASTPIEDGGAAFARRPNRQVIVVGADRGPKHRTNLGFLNQTQRPALMPEICFVDSAADVALYQAPGAFEAICAALARSLVGDAPPSVTPPPSTSRPTIRQGDRGPAGSPNRRRGARGAAASRQPRRRWHFRPADRQADARLSGVESAARCRRNYWTSNLGGAARRLSHARPIHKFWVALVGRPHLARTGVPVAFEVPRACRSAWRRPIFLRTTHRPAKGHH
jgi:Protein of unknown function (DUF2924)